jgi:hypothetical protein
VLGGLAVIPILLLMGFGFSSIIETRIFTPALPLMLPAVMFAVAGPIRRPGDLQ